MDRPLYGQAKRRRLFHHIERQAFDPLLPPPLRIADRDYRHVRPRGRYGPPPPPHADGHAAHRDPYGAPGGPDEPGRRRPAGVHRGPGGAVLQPPPARGRGRGRGRGYPGAAVAREHVQRGQRRGPHDGHRSVEDVRREHRRDGSVDSAGRNNPRYGPPREIGFRKLEELAMDNGITIMQKLGNQSTLFLFEKLTCEKKMKEDWIRLVVTILAKLCVVEYTPIVSQLFGKICQKEFIDQLVLHITHLPYDKNNNRKETVSEFLKNLCTLCNAIIELTPNLACENLDVVLKRTSQELADIPDFEGRESVEKDLLFMREKLKSEKERLESMSKAAAPNQVASFNVKPPTDFRLLSHFPAIEDIVVQRYVKPFLRPNKVDQRAHGRYENVDDYLDVHFRLMREDFVRPLRDGISDFRKTLNERKNTKNKKASRIQNIRIYEKVQILCTKTEDEKVGIVLEFDPDKNFAPNIKWEYSKRLMTGSLLVLTEDEDFSSIVLVTVTKRDQKELQEGRVLVEICEGAVRNDLLRRQYLMVECQVFWGAYRDVLKSLKNFHENSFPLRDYIVYGSTAQELPEYLLRALDANKTFELLLKSEDPSAVGKGVVVDIDNLGTWPSSGELGLDESQYQAMCGALTNRLMLIQGPPGTGKTFIGLRIAACLIKNQDLWSPAADRRPMLLVCYTNHALDQFLMGLMTATNSIIRVGGGCKEPMLEQHSINFLRRNGSRPAGLQQVSHNARQQKRKFYEIKSLGDRIRGCSFQLKQGAAGVVSLLTLCSFGVITDDYLFWTDLDILMWLCGFGRNAAVPELLKGCFSEDIVDPEDAAFQHLKFPAAGLPKVSMSFSFRLFEEALTGLEFTPFDRNLVAILEALKRELAATEYPRYPERQRPPHHTRLWRLNNNERWQLYRYWRDSLLAILDIDSEPLLEEIDSSVADLANVLASWRMVEDQHIMSEYAIIGMTTSFAASRQQILKELKPRIVIVEEAAEVLESHVLVSLAGDVEHLIMIGDHQQLRPSIAVHELGVRYHLNVSLFERLIRNGVNYVTLSTQHRMRPEVAKLICPAIYPELKNHPSVERFPAVLGVAKNLFFLDHKHPEEVVTDAQSFQNTHEAKFLSALVKYLLLQGYDPAKITVLSTYKGQQHFFNKLKASHTHLQNVRITVVDNFQGEEADIILLSLVRSNAEDVVGFLKTENRVCVALSRARHGMFIVGNMSNMTSADTVWRKVEEELHRQNSIGPALSLHCDRHGVVTPVTKAEDFASCPQGGCLELCRTLMACGHDCKQVCHVQDMEHKTARCMENCLRPACPLQHPCPQRCFVKPCPPCLVPKEEELPCGHRARMACHVDPLQYRCKIVVGCTLPACGHQRDAHCYQLDHLADLKCKIPCTLRMLCGHTCELSCHVLEDPNHEQVKCMKPCGQRRHGCTAEPEHLCHLVCHQPCEDCTVAVDKTLPCGHVHRVKCNAVAAEIQCRRECERTLPCGHKCSKKCYEPCEPCSVQVRKTLPGCGHTQTMNCGLSPDAFKDCKGPCQRTLPCGHRCKRQCGQDCSSGRCRQLVPFAGTPACGHPIKVPCHLKNDYAPSSADLLALCTHPCPVLLQPCDHKCAGSCGACLQGRFHQPCKSKCERPLLCGHLCKEACPKICPPCTRPCEQKCVHSSCSQKCGLPCTRCKEPCPRRCEHGFCRKRCGDRCSFECSEPCQKKVEACGHDCIGLCGDVCICLECNEEEVTDIFFGSEEDEGARFVLMPDCKHIVEASGLDYHMSLSNEEGAEIQPKLCPKCTAPVTIQRYSNVMKKVAEDIAAVKAKFYDTKKIWLHLDKINELLKEIPKFPPGFRLASQLLSQVVRFRDTMEKRMPKGKESGTRKVPPLNTSEANNLEQKVVLLKGFGEIGDTVAKLVKDGNISSGGMAEMQQAVELLCGNLLRRDLVRLSEQEADDINLELERLQRLVQLLQVENGPNFRYLEAADKAIHADISKLVRGLSPYLQERDGHIGKQLEALAATSSITITKQEIAAVVAAMGMRPGHWFRCPNGHPYVIGDCGGAVTEAVCGEKGCGARIGGASHRLRSDNTIATDFDGARMSAYDRDAAPYRM